jgi:uncharacterized protein YbjT (DUF2867 family)
LTVNDTRQRGPILVTGATGKQGGAAAHHLLAEGWRLRALVRDPQKPAARALAEQGVEIVPGDLDDPASLERAVRGVYGVFAAITPVEEGPAGEERQGKALALAARVAGVQHYVYSAVGGAERNTGIPHFESKWQIEQQVGSLGLPATILRPAFFMENFAEPWARPGILGGTLVQSMRPDKPLQMIAVDDIGAFAALAFGRPNDFLGRALELAGDELTMPEVAEAFGRAIGRPVRYVAQPLEQLRGTNSDAAAMLRWFNEHGFQANIPALRALYPQLTDFDTWLHATGWDRAAA